jgi:endonuclease/exonuclease/phosphatase family metal-dependent hydrolase
MVLMFFRLLTYNIHKGIGGVDRRYRPERIVEVIAHYDPDIVCLQEVDDGVRRSKFHQQADLIAEACRFPHQCYQRNVRVRTGHYGNATLSRWRLTEVADVDLTVRLKKNRRALITRCHLSDQGHQWTVGLANLHLGLAGFERKIQLDRLFANDALQHFAPSTPVILAGDYNDVYGNLGRAVMRRAGFQRAGGNSRTFPAMTPLRALDRVFYRGDLEVQRAFAGRIRVARQASDHLPLVVDFQLLRDPSLRSSS